MTPQNPKNPLVCSFRQGARSYELGRTDCGKSNCSGCSLPMGRKASHGPYWYLCAVRDGKWKRVYLGREIDSTKWILPDGQVDWAAIDAKKRNGKTVPVPVSNPSKPKRETRRDRIMRLGEELDRKAAPGSSSRGMIKPPGASA